MTDNTIRKYLINSFPFSIVFVNCENNIEFINEYALKKYGNIVGRSVFDFHKDASNVMIEKILEHFQNGGEEVALKPTKHGEIGIVMPVRDEDGKLLGYFERFENIEK